MTEQDLALLERIGDLHNQRVID